MRRTVDVRSKRLPLLGQAEAPIGVLMKDAFGRERSEETKERGEIRTDRQRELRRRGRVW